MGYQPTNANYLNAIFSTIHRNIQPKVVVQNLRQSKPLLKWIMTNCAQPQPDTPIIQNVQFTPYNSAVQFVDYSGSFVTGINNVPLTTAQFNIAAVVNPITTSIFEMSKFQGAGKELQIIDVIKQRLIDNALSFMEVLNNAVMGTSTQAPAGLYIQPASNALLADGLKDALDNGTISSTYGGLSRSTYPAWNAFQFTNTQTSLPAWQQLYYYLSKFINSQNGRMPDIMVCGQDVFYAVATSMTGIERVLIQDINGASLDSRAWDVSTISIGGVPLVVDRHMPNATVYFLNKDDIKLAYNPDFFMDLINPESLIGNGQMGYVQLFITTFEVYTTRPTSLATLNSAPSVSM
jgi:hypothetical protein